MNHLIVVAHPVKESFTMSLVRAYATELEGLGHKSQTYDLYRMGFDPVLPREELAPAADHPTHAVIKRAQDDVLAAEVLTVVYPLWWMSMPAILKGYIDRVFARGFAYESQNGNVHGLLSGKRCVMITLSGAPLPLLVQSGEWKALEVLQDTHIFRSSGFELIEHLHFDEVMPGLGETIGKEHMDRVRACARQHFSSAAQPSAASHGRKQANIQGV
jgi:NAD(P)H dehydrogenase (quinone)